MRKSTPSRLRICATAAATFMLHSFFHAAGLQRGDYSRTLVPAATHPRNCLPAQCPAISECESPGCILTEHRAHRGLQHRERFLKFRCALCVFTVQLVCRSLCATCVWAGFFRVVSEERWRMDPQEYIAALERNAPVIAALARAMPS